jgi:ABC-2 type transport system ATP-binding protein
MSTLTAAGALPPARRAAPADPAIEAHDLVKTYGKTVRALDGAGFSVPAGSVFGLLGPNGAGKSTVLKILATLARADSGRAFVSGLDVSEQAAAVRRSIGYVPQKPSLDPTATGWENLALQGRIHGFSRREARRRSAGLLERFGLTDAAPRIAGTWSGGMQRRLDVALGLIGRPRVLILDEPTTGLDPESRAEMWAGIAELGEADGLTVLLSTHDLEEADRLADRLAIVDSGRVVAAGTPEELKGALDGDAVQAELDLADLAAARAALEPIARALTADGTVVRAHVRDGAAALPDVLAALAAVGVRPVALSVARPSLDDVYRRHAGRSFHVADAAGATERAA